MLLYVFTQQGDGAEDGTVYYARYLLVNAEESDRVAVNADIKQIVGGYHGKYDNESILFKGDPNGDSPADDIGQFVMELALRGWQASVVLPTVIIET